MPKLIIYLDNCCFNRPFDDQSYLSIFLETYAKLAIQDLVNEKEIDLVWSFILDYENNANPDEVVKQEILGWRNKAYKIVNRNSPLINEAQKIKDAGFGNKDALHIAASIEANVDYFITVDKGILKKKNFIKNLEIVNPIDFITILERRDDTD